MCSDISILEKTEAQSTSPVQTSKHTKVRNEIIAFSTFLNAIRENFTNNDVSQNIKYDLQKILAWVTIDYFTHNIDLIEQAKKPLDPKVQMTTLSLQNNQITFGTLNVLIQHF